MPLRKPVEHGVEHLVEREPGLGVQLGREAHLGVDDTVGGEVLGALGRHPLDRVAVLHHADRVGERLEVQHEVVALGAAVEPRRELGDVVGRQAGVAELVGELDDGARAHATVEVVVQQRLGRPPDEVGVIGLTVPSWPRRSVEAPQRHVGRSLQPVPRRVLGGRRDAVHASRRGGCGRSG